MFKVIETADVEDRVAGKEASAIPLMGSPALDGSGSVRVTVMKKAPLLLAMFT